MKSLKIFFVLFILIQTNKSAYSQLTVTFPSKDGLMVTADWYPISSQMPVILLCHQNQSSRGEYTETALRLNKLGFNCMSVDLRVGDEIKGVKNETASLAKAKGMIPSFASAQQDIEAAIDYLNEKYKQNIIILGSSYSASLALIIAATNNKVDAVIAFSPGEYFDEKDFVRKNISSLTKPVFATSSKSESPEVTLLLADVNSRVKIQYEPKGEGAHGARVLWSESPDNHEYWIALMSFLEKLKKLQ